MTDTRPNPDELLARVERDEARSRRGKLKIFSATRLVRNTVVDQLLERSGDIDLYVIRGERQEHEQPAKPGVTKTASWDLYLRTALVVFICWLVGGGFFLLGLAEANMVMVFLLGVTFVAARYGRGPSIATSIASLLVFDFFFVPPYLTFAVSDTEYVLTFGVMLVIGLVISTLSVRLREQVAVATDRERRTAALQRLSRQLAALAGSGTDTLPNISALFVPLTTSERTIGVLAIPSNDPARLHSPPQRHWLEACASQIALALERDQLAIEAQEAQLWAESEQLRSALLSSVSHDLRTPLAVIAGAASSLLESTQAEPTRRELLQTMVDESHRLARLVENLLDMTRLESGAVELHRQWHVLEELVGSALTRVERQLDGRHVCVQIPPDLPLVWLDGLLFEQVLVNLLENAPRYTPTGSRIELSAECAPREVIIRVADDGPDLPRGQESPCSTTAPTIT